MSDKVSIWLRLILGAISLLSASWTRWHHAADFNALADLVMGAALILSAQIDIRKDNHHD